LSNVENQIAEVPVDEIRTGILKNIRTHFDPEGIQQLADSIYNDGLLNPLTIAQTEDKDGNQVLALVAGERRLRAIQWIRSNLDDTFMEDGVPCFNWTGTFADACYANATENIEREAVDEVDTSLWLFEQHQAGNAQTKLAKRLHKPLQWVNFRILFHERSCQELKDLLRNGLITFTAAYELSKNLDEDEQKKRVKRAIKFNEKITVEQAKNAADPNKTTRPSKKMREVYLARLEKLASENDAPLARGAANSLRWVDGLLSNEEMEEFLDMIKQDSSAP
jgi:ParB family chromosome partitioning protein